MALDIKVSIKTSKTIDFGGTYNATLTSYNGGPPTLCIMDGRCIINLTTASTAMLAELFKQELS